VYSSQGSRDYPVYSPQGSWDSPVNSTKGSQDSPVYSSPRSRFGQRGVVLPIRAYNNLYRECQSKNRLLVTLTSWQHVIYVWKIASPKDSNRLRGVFIISESIMNTNTFTNIRKNSNSFLNVPIGTRRSSLKEKARDEKSRDTVPLNFLRPPNEGKTYKLIKLSYRGGGGRGETLAKNKLSGTLRQLLPTIWQRTSQASRDSSMRFRHLVFFMTRTHLRHGFIS
jgi:hypothetical protein